MLRCDCNHPHLERAFHLRAWNLHDLARKPSLRPSLASQWTTTARSIYTRFRHPIASAQVHLATLRCKGGEIDEFPGKWVAKQMLARVYCMPSIGRDGRFHPISPLLTYLPQPSCCNQVGTRMSALVAKRSELERREREQPGFSRRNIPPAFEGLATFPDIDVE